MQPVFDDAIVVRNHRQRAIRRIAILSFAGAAVFSVITLWRDRDEGSELRVDDANLPNAASGASLEAGEDAISELSRTSLAQADPDHSDPAEAYRKRPAGPDLAPIRQTLNDCIEASVSGVLDPVAILDSVLALTDSSVDLGTSPTVMGSGTIKYPLRPLPEGVDSGEFCIKGKKTASAYRALALRIQVHSETTELSGVRRQAGEAEVVLSMDAEGKRTRLNIFTSAMIQPSGANRNLRFEDLRVTEGVSYSVSLDDPNLWTARAHGLDHSRGSTWEIPITLVGASWPQPQAIDLLAFRLNALYQSVGGKKNE